MIVTEQPPAPAAPVERSGPLGAAQSLRTARAARGVGDGRGALCGPSVQGR